MSSQNKKDMKIFSAGTLIEARYRLIEAIKQGGEAVVYRAKDEKEKRLVAVKLLAKLADPRDLSRFKRVVAISEKLHSPNILPFDDSGIFLDGAEAYPYMIFPYVSGGDTLDDMIDAYRRATMPLDRPHTDTCIPFPVLLNLAIQALSGVRDAHTQGVVHRDLKPGNILVANGVPLVMDFGLARYYRPELEEGMTQVTVLGVVQGTLDHMSPEQARGEGPDPTCDIFSSGVILYEMATGHNPRDIEGDQLMKLIQQIGWGNSTVRDGKKVYEPIKPMPMDEYIEVSHPAFARFEKLVMSCISFDKEDRPKDMNEVLNELNHIRVEAPNVILSQPPPGLASIKIQPAGIRHVNVDAVTEEAPSVPPPDARGREGQSGLSLATEQEVEAQRPTKPEGRRTPDKIFNDRTAERKTAPPKRTVTPRLDRPVAQSRRGWVVALISAIAVVILAYTTQDYWYESLRAAIGKNEPAAEIETEASAKSTAPSWPEPVAPVPTQTKSAPAAAIADTEPDAEISPATAKTAGPGSTKVYLPSNTGYGAPKPVPGIDYFPGEGKP
ncbi:MAG: serine/threonine protein kinase [Patescibacteria group bacterium]